MFKEENVQKQYALNDGGAVSVSCCAGTALIGGCVLLWIVLREMFPFLPQITSVSVLKYRSNTFP